MRRWSASLVVLALVGCQPAGAPAPSPTPPAPPAATAPPPVAASPSAPSAATPPGAPTPSAEPSTPPAAPPPSATSPAPHPAPPTPPAPATAPAAPAAPKPADVARAEDAAAAFRAWLAAAERRDTAVFRAGLTARSRQLVEEDLRLPGEADPYFGILKEIAGNAAQTRVVEVALEDDLAVVTYQEAAGRDVIPLVFESGAWRIDLVGKLEADLAVPGAEAPEIEVVAPKGSAR